MKRLLSNVLSSLLFYIMAALLTRRSQTITLLIDQAQFRDIFHELFC